MDKARTPSNPRRLKRRAARWPDHRYSQLIAGSLLGLLVLGAPLLLGGILPWTVLAIALCGLLALAANAAWAPSAIRPAPVLAFVIAALVLWTAVQALPLNCSIVSVLSPESAAKTKAAQVALGQSSPAWCTLSEDPGKTREEVIKGFAILSAFLASWLFAAAGGRRRIFWLVACSSLAMSAVALAHGVLEADRVFGIYKPVDSGRALLLAPLMNMNNLGAFAALGVPLWIGLTYRERDSNIRLLGYVAIVLTATTVLLSMSRGAIGQLLLSLAVMGLLVVVRQRADKRKLEAHRTRRLGMAGACVVGLGAGCYLEGQQLVREFSGGDFGKLDLIARAFRLAFSHPWIGVGRGAFSSAFVGVEGATARYVYPENFIAQWSSEWGIPFALLLLVTVIVALVRASRGAKSLSVLGAITALVTFAAQNLLDLGFELPGVAVVAAALLAAIVAPSASRDSDQPTARSRLRSMNILSTGALTLGVLSLALLGPGLPVHQVQTLEATLRQSMLAGDRDTFGSTLRTAVTLHPAEPVFATLAAAEGIEHMDKTAGRWLNRAMDLAPHWAAPHALAFRWLWQHGNHTQALLELRAALEVDPLTEHENVCRLTRANLHWTLAAAPRNKQRRVYLEQAAYCLQAPTPASRTMDEELLKEFPDSVWALERTASRLQILGETESATAAVDKIIASHPEHKRAHLQRALVLLAAGRLQEVVDANPRILAQLSVEEQSQLLSAEALAFAAIGKQSEAMNDVMEVRRRAATDTNTLAESYWLEGRVQLALQHPREAFTAFHEAYGINQDTRYLAELAQLAEGLGDRRQALWAYLNLCEREPSGGSCAKKDQLLTSGKQSSP